MSRSIGVFDAMRCRTNWRLAVSAQWRSSSTSITGATADRLKFSWDTIAEANELKKDYDYKQAVDTSAVPK